MLMNTFMHILSCFTCVTCVPWDLIVTDMFMNDIVSYKTMIKHIAFESTCVTKYLDVHSGLKRQHLESIFLIFEAILTQFLSSQHLVCDRAGPMLHSTELRNWINEHRIVQSEWFSNTKSILLILSTLWGRCGPLWDGPRAVSSPWAVFVWLCCIFPWRPTRHTGSSG